MEIKQHLKLSQQLVMTPQLQQAIKLLQMSRMELAELVREEMSENPVLEDTLEGRDSVAPEPPAPEQPTDPAQEAKDNDVDWERYLENHSLQAPPTASRIVASSDDMPGLDQTLSRSEDLSTHLEWQLRMGDFMDDEQRFGMLVVGNLDDNGYLKIEGMEPSEIVPKLAEEAEIDPEDAEEVLKLMQNLDPLGVCARTLGECLEIQAARFGMDELVLKVLRGHIHNLQKKKYDAIAKELDVPLEEIYDVAQAIADLEPRPARAFVSEEPRYITPDVYVHRVGDEYFVVANDDGMPKLKISRFYRSAITEDKAAKEYIQDKLRSAHWLIRSIDQRRKTIIRVTEAIVDMQAAFFEKGIAHLKPMILKDVADSIGMHESTISRVTTNKYVSTPQGLFELKFFFNSGIRRDAQTDIASESVKQAIKKIVASENVAKPFSDQKLVTMLQSEHGIRIARRTVAKYREALGILSSSQRKQYF